PEEEQEGRVQMATTTATVRRAIPTARSKRRRSRILVGTASWTDPGFIKDWYPPDVPARERLPWYAEHFNLVEVNSTFYAVPSEKRVASWPRQSPPGFVFDVKLHRLLSRHSTKAKFLPRDLRPLAGTDGRVEVSRKLETALTKRFLLAIAPLSEAHKLGALFLQ